VSGQPDVYCEYSTFTNMTELKGEFCCIWRPPSSRTLLWCSRKNVYFRGMCCFFLLGFEVSGCEH